MKIASFAMVQRLLAARSKLISQMKDGRLLLSINGDVQDEAMHERVRTTILAEQRARLAELDEDLRQLGVDVD